MKKTIYDLDGFEDICNEKELFATNGGCSKEHIPLPPIPDPIPGPIPPPPTPRK